jgi:PAS domain-containing protein
MKINEPVTQSEIAFPQGCVLVSKTDTKGIITYCNRSFIEISGYSEDELMGKNHNLVRHPDMPAPAFRGQVLSKTARKMVTIIGSRPTSHQSTAAAV